MAEQKSHGATYQISDSMPWFFISIMLPITRSPSISVMFCNSGLNPTNKFPYKIQNTTMIIFYYNWVVSYKSATNICTCHDSTAVVACANFCSNHIITIWIKTNNISIKFEFLVAKSISAMAPWPTYDELTCWPFIFPSRGCHYGG